ncbi:MAG: adenylate/guanylate cyclase domain-containing protein [Kiritimatiellia bacterium]|jgi:adenylate cyclase|nr:adenylate/guanylate cyclase domain-containing protein [Kiritimatiellia bacterium]MDP6630010.1 adenylate/guanylate cyclase domain-containing protein [Kiritimatiellia bacterium]MDP6810985.1 adenylate/guanylate cyclase domain-containing protein [Kiritimatiellia bacterium]MDP7025216.1 adenylate/guanylate cyclase domain-containing protein [Kiritimatiellia bacterium]
MTEPSAKRSLWRAAKGVLIGVAAAAAVGILTHAGLLETIELKTLDLRFRSLPPTPAAERPDDIVIVEIDQDSIEQVYTHINYRWPWPRLFYGTMIDFISAAGAKAIVFDVLFSEPDIERDISGAESDAALVDATARSGRVIHTYVLKQRGLPPPADEEAALLAVGSIPNERRSLDFARDDSSEIIEHPEKLSCRACRDISPKAVPDRHVYTSAALPSAALAQASRTIGFANVFPDDDNVIRRIPLLLPYKHTTLMNTAVAAAREVSGRPGVTLETDAIQLGSTVIPTLPDRSFYLWWYRMPERNESPFVSIPAYMVLKAQTQTVSGIDPSLPAEVFKDKIVLFGSTAALLFDSKATPLTHAVPGVHVQATALANLLRGDAVARMDRTATLWILALLCLATGLVTHGTRHTMTGLGVTLALLAGLTVGSRALLASRHLFVETVPLMAGVGLTFVAATLINTITERRHSKLVRHIFEHYLDRGVVRTLINNPDRVKLGGERRTATVLFSDVANFTNTSEKLEPEQLVAFMNLYLNAMTGIIIEEGGFVDKFVGDEIVAIFGAPNDLPDHAARACRAIVRMQAKAEALQPQFRKLGCVNDIFFRAGLSTGELVVGNMGSEQRMNYTAMGDVMNLGARLETANKEYDTRVLVSAGTVAAAGSAFTFRPIGEIRVKGKDEAVSVSELVGVVTE